MDVIFIDQEYQEQLEENIADQESLSHSQFLFSLKDYTQGLDYEIENKNRDPVAAEIEACSPHIDELVEHWNPHGIVYLGKLAKSYHPKKLPNQPSIPTLSLYHPAYILRMEYKLLTVLREARKLDLFLEKLHKE